MVIKNQYAFGDGNTLYEYVGCTQDKFPFKRNHTLPEDAANGSTIDHKDCNRTYVYQSYFINGVGLVEFWFQLGNANAKIDIVRYKSNNDILVISNPADTDAVATAISTAYSVKVIGADGSATDVTAGTTLGTNYQLIVDSDITAGEHTAIISYVATNPSTVRTRPDSYNCPSMTLGECRAFGSGSGSAMPKEISANLSNSGGIFLIDSIPYKIVVTG